MTDSLTIDLTPTAINPGSLAAPLGYSNGTLAGNTLYLGGQTALDKDMNIVEGDIVDQFRQAFGNVLATLKEAGGVPGDLVSITIYLTDVDEYQRRGRDIGKAWVELAGKVFPSMAGVGVTHLWQKGAMIEVAGVAVIPEDRIKRPSS